MQSDLYTSIYSKNTGCGFCLCDIAVFLVKPTFLWLSSTPLAYL